MAIRQRRPLSRRHFLGMAGTAGGLVAACASMPALALGERRTLAFVHTHTGESLTAEYFSDGVYQMDSLSSINVLLRDFRTGDIHAIDPDLLDVLHDLKQLAGAEAPFEVISGYRSPHTNAMLRSVSNGVAEHSQHLLGKAIDIRLPGVPTERLGELARSLGRGGVGVYPESAFVHVDTGPVRSW